MRGAFLDMAFEGSPVVEHETRHIAARGGRAMKQHGYLRNGASWWVRIALKLKSLAGAYIPHHLGQGSSVRQIIWY
jgi:hypothetical protein